jgi:tRNA pseudouridine55 synthase
VLLLDKPLGWTSNDALQKAKGLLRAEKAGHTGTLDPLATGCCRCASARPPSSARSAWTPTSATAPRCTWASAPHGDREGEVIEERPVASTAPRSKRACAAFTGPSNSCRRCIRRSSTRARRCTNTRAPASRSSAAAPRAIHASTSSTGRCRPLVIDVRCSKGTYIRTLAEDIGEARWAAARTCGAAPHRQRAADVARRSRSSAGALDEAERDAAAAADVLLADWPAVRLPDDEAGRFLTGLRRRVALADAPAVRVYGPARTPSRAFLGSAHITAGELIADRLLSPIEVPGLNSP